MFKNIVEAILLIALCALTVSGLLLFAQAELTEQKYIFASISVVSYLLFLFIGSKYIERNKL